MVSLSIQAAEKLQNEFSLSAEIVDHRTLVPLDEDTIIASVKKTGYAIVIDEAPKGYGATAEIAARIGELAFGLFRCTRNANWSRRPAHTFQSTSGATHDTRR